MSVPQQQTGQSLTDKLPLVKGGVFGAVAYVAGLAVTFVLLQVDSDLEEELVGGLEDFGTIDAASWVLSSSHLLVDIKSTVEGGGQSQTESFGLFSEVSTSLPEPVYYAVPVVILGAAGYLLVQQAGARSSNEAMKFGATLPLGYLPLAGVSWFLFRIKETQGGGGQSVTTTVGPDIMMVIVTAIAFPVVLGAAGGYLAFSQGSSPQRAGAPPQQPGAQQRGGQPRGQQPGGQPQQGQQQGRRQQGGQQQGRRQQGGHQQGRRQQGGQPRQDTHQQGQDSDDDEQPRQ